MMLVDIFKKTKGVEFKLSFDIVEHVKKILNVVFTKHVKHEKL
jgi:hypothetical protein